VVEPVGLNGFIEAAARMTARPDTNAALGSTHRTTWGKRIRSHACARV